MTSSSAINLWRVMSHLMAVGSSVSVSSSNVGLLRNPSNGSPIWPLTCILSVTTVPTIAAESTIPVTRWLQLAFHDLRPGIASSHAPSLGDATGMLSAEISRSQDLAAAIALPPASNIIFLPCNIISLFLLRKKAGGVYRPHPFLSLKQVFETLSGGWPCHTSQHQDCDADDFGV